MLITELRLLEIDVYDGDKLIYNGKTEDLPEEMAEIISRQLTLSHVLLSEDRVSSQRST